MIAWDMAPAATDRLDRRLERDSDEEFRFDLFCRSRAPGDDLPFVDTVLRKQLLRQQFIGQVASYRANFPNARFEIIELGGSPIGRIAMDHARDVILIIDIAVLPEWRGLGFGTRVLRAICEVARGLRVPARLSVLAHNADALRLYRRLGFEPVASSEIEVTMEWQADVPHASRWRDFFLSLTRGWDIVV
jgi:ribosomal protein S18 acetylase RimI-like enzyme